MFRFGFGIKLAVLQEAGPFAGVDSSLSRLGFGTGRNGVAVRHWVVVRHWAGTGFGVSR